MDNPLRTNFVWIFLREWDKILLMKRKSEWNSDGMWALPGGRLDTQETNTQCILREVEEELGLQLDSKKFSDPITIYSVQKKTLKVFLWRFVICDEREGHPINNEPDKCSKISRYRIDNLPKNISPYIQEAYEAFMEGERYVELEE